MKKIAALSLVTALAAGVVFTLPVSRAEAAPIGALAGIADSARPAVDQVQYRRRGPGRRVVRRGRGGDAALAAGLIGAAVIGGAIIAQSQRDRSYERSYYYGNQGYYGHQGYYEAPAYYAPRQRYVQPTSPGVAYDANGNAFPLAHSPYQYGPGPGAYGHYPRHNRTVRDPAGGGRMNMGGP